jgi:hypothetical protein
MRIQEINAGSQIGEYDMLLGSAFIEKGKYRNKNFAIRDIINHIKSGVTGDGGRLSIQYAWQDERCTHTNVVDLINKFDGSILVPSNGILLVKMVKNEYGMPCDNLFLFNRTECELGEGNNQVNDYNFIELKSKNLNRGIEITEDITLNNGYHQGLFFLSNADDIEIALPADLFDNFESTFIRQGTGEVRFTCSDIDSTHFIFGNEIEYDGKVDLIRNGSNRKFTLYGNAK